MPPERIFLRLVAGEQPHFNDHASLDADEVHTRLVELDAVGLATEFYGDRHPVTIGHEVVGPCDRKRTLGDFHHLAQHRTHSGHAAMRAGELVAAWLMPDHVGRNEAAQRGLVSGLNGLDVAFGDVDVVHGALLS